MGPSTGPATMALKVTWKPKGLVCTPLAVGSLGGPYRRPAPLGTSIMRNSVDQWGQGPVELYGSQGLNAPYTGTC